jgi:hypothetical protein
MSSSYFDMILDKGGGRHGLHVCVRSVVGSLLLLLTLTHRRQGGCAGRLPCGGGGRAEARGGGKGGGVTGFPPGDAPRDNCHSRGSGSGDRGNGVATAATQTVAAATVAREIYIKSGGCIGEGGNGVGGSGGSCSCGCCCCCGSGGGDGGMIRGKGRQGVSSLTWCDHT